MSLILDCLSADQSTSPRKLPGLSIRWLITDDELDVELGRFQEQDKSPSIVDVTADISIEDNGYAMLAS